MRFEDFFAALPALVDDQIGRSPDWPRVAVMVLFVGLSIYLPYFNLGAATFRTDPVSMSNPAAG